MTGFSAVTPPAPGPMPCPPNRPRSSRTTEDDASVPPNGLVFNSTGRPLSRADAASNGWAAIDQNGDLWLPDENSEVVRISKSLLAKGGADAPVVGIRYPGAPAP